MKKKLIAIVCAVSLTLALPILAWAAPSPAVEGQATGDNNVVLNAKAGSGTIAVAPTSTSAVDTATLSVSEKLLASFEVTSTDNAKDITLTFNVGTQYAGASFKVFVKHDDGTSETLTGTVAADGTITVNTAKLSTFSIVVDTSTINGGANVDKGAKSPQTGVDFGMVAGGTLVAAVAAGAVFVALRRKMAE